MKYDMKYAVTCQSLKDLQNIALFFINVFIGSFIEIEENGWVEFYFRWYFTSFLCYEKINKYISRLIYLCLNFIVL